jgi:hypothetical protein
MADSKRAGARSAIDWSAHLRAWELSAQTLAEYARAHGLKVKSFYNARTHRLRRERARGARGAAVFQRVRVVAAAAPWSCRVALPNGVMVEIGGEAVPLAEVLRAASTLSPATRLPGPV